MITTHDLSKQFDDFTAVDGITMQVEAGQILALLGPNGAGKTTTIRMLTSILIPTRGWAQVGGFDVVRDASKVRAIVGVLTEQHGLYGRMPAAEYLDFFGQVYGLPAPVRRQRIQHMLESFGLQSHANQRIGEYSKGMRQKLALARALLHEPPVLLLDEPTSTMDPESARLVRDSIRDLRSAERTIILCTHNLPEAEEIADRIAIMRQGRIVAQGSPSELKDNLLGPVEYEVRLAVHLNGFMPTLPPDAQQVNFGQDWIRFQTSQPERVNPLVFLSLLKQRIPVLTLQEIPRSLEEVYLHAVNTPTSAEAYEE